MSRFVTGKAPLVLFIGWFLAGAAVAVVVDYIGRNLNNLPTGFHHLWLPIVFGGLLGLMFGRADIRQRSMSHRLEDSEKRFRQLYQKTPAMLHSMDSEGRLIYVSQSWLDTLGYRWDDVIGKDFFDFVVTEDLETVRSEHFQMLESVGEIRERQYQLRVADESTIEISLSEVAQYDFDGRPTESLAVLSDLTSHRAAEERIEKLAYYDTLTGLPNRALMNDRVLQAMAQAKRDNRQVGVFFFDLDRFKLINDTQGHAVGDLVLRSVAQRLKKFIREGDTFARLGGDEFVIVQADPNHDPDFNIMGQRIIETLGQPFQIGSREFFTTASVGVAVYPVDGEDPQTLLKSADTAMYVAKSRGRNNVQYFSDEMNAVTLAKTSLENRLRQALNSGELQQHYQPQVDLETGRVTGVEALLRWYDDDGKLIPPNEIIAIAEESGLVFPLGEWVLQTACAQAKAWQDANLPHVRMSVNLSGHHIRQANFTERIEKILNQTGVQPNTLEVELAENSIMSQVNDSIMALTDLRIRGVSLAIDDFGTGYSSLAYLMQLTISAIKVDRAFTARIPEDARAGRIVTAIMDMARALGLAVTVEGIETDVQDRFLQQAGCEFGQGFGFARPQDARAIEHFLG